MTPEYPLVEVAITIGSQTFFGEALPDTGYNGPVIVPQHLTVEIDAIPHRTSLTVADGHRLEVDSWEGELSLKDRTFEVEVRALGEHFLIGREVLDQMEICFQFGKTVRLRFTPEE